MPELAPISATGAQTEESSGNVPKNTPLHPLHCRTKGTILIYGDPHAEPYGTVAKGLADLKQSAFAAKPGTMRLT